MDWVNSVMTANLICELIASVGFLYNPHLFIIHSKGSLPNDLQLFQKIPFISDLLCYYIALFKVTRSLLTNSPPPKKETVNVEKWETIAISFMKTLGAALLTAVLFTFIFFFFEKGMAMDSKLWFVKSWLFYHFICAILHFQSAEGRGIHVTFTLAFAASFLWGVYYQ